MTDPWYVLDQLQAQVELLGDPKGVDRAGRHVSALASSLSDVLTSHAKRASLADGAHRAAALLDRLRATGPVDEATVSYLAGRLATVVDVLALMVRTRAADELPELARAELKTLQALHGGALSNKALAAARDITEEAACRSLRVCRELDLVESERVGRENRNRLTTLALAMFDDGHLPEGEGEVAYNMESVVHRLTMSEHVKSDKLPQLDIQ